MPIHPQSGRVRRASTTAASLVGVVLVGLAAASASPVEGTVYPAGHALDVTARDYAFEAPDTVAAGVTTVRITNQGKELHHIQLIALDGGHTLPDLFAVMKPEAPLPSWARFVGGPNAPVPGGVSAATLPLAPGRYALICLIPSADGVPHVMKGMARELVAVAPATAATATAPAAYAAPSRTMTLSDYRFTLSRPFARGTQSVRVRNAATQAHEVLFVRLAPGKTAHDVAAWVESQQGPPPGAPLGGTTGIPQGGWNDLTFTFEPGEYALLCFFPDSHDGKPHVMHGMLSQFTIR